MKIRKTVSAAKAAANQKNAKNSTGPTSELGRRNSSRNATRLGIFSRDMLLPGERTTDLQQLRNELMIDLAPVGALELDQVEIYLANRWRLPRVYRAEAGEIGKSISEYRPGAEVASSDHTREYQQGMSDITKLKSIEKLLKQKARVSSEDLDWLRKLPYGDAGDVLALAIEPAQDAEREQDPSPTGEMSAGPESAKSSGVKTAARSQGDGGYARDVLLSMLDQLKDCVLLEIMRHGRQVVSVMEAKKNTFQVPQEAVLNRQTRYENHLMRNVYRALHELERLQRIRFGDEVLPPTARVD